MPNFDGTGPLKRGRAIGRGLGPCKKGEDGGSCERIKPITHTEETKPE
jgi:hypothetical protein